MALDLQRDDDRPRCSRGHLLEETVGDDGLAYVTEHFTCEACAPLDITEHRIRTAIRDSPGDALDLIAGRHHYARQMTPEEVAGD